MSGITEVIVIGGLVNKNTAPWQKVNWTQKDAFSSQSQKGNVVSFPRTRRNLPAGVRNRFGKDGSDAN